MAAQSKLEILLMAKDEASGKIKGVSKSLSTLGGTVGKAAVLGLGAAAVGIGAVGAAAVSLARSAAPIQGVTDAFGGLADAAGYSASEMLASLKSSSAGMITNADLMTTFNKAAQLVGMDFAETLPDAMQHLGKVAAATGQDMGFMMDSLVTGVGRMSPMILDNLGIQVSLSEANEKWAESMGVAVSEMTKEEQQAALMAEVLSKLETNTANMPDVLGSAEQKFASFGVAIKDTKDSIGLALLPAITPLMDKLSELASKYLPMVTEALTPIFEGIGNLVSVLFDAGLQSSEFQVALGALVGEDVAAQIMGVVEWISNLATQIGDFVNNILIPFVKEHWESFKTALIVVGAILAGAAIFAGIMSIVGAIVALFNPITLVIGVIALLAVAWTKNWGGIQEKTQAVISFITNIINVALTWIKNFWAENGEQIKATAQAIWDGVVAIVQWFIDYFTLIFQAFQLAFQGDWEGFGEKLREAWDKLWEAIKTIVGAAWDWIKEAFAKAVDAVIKFFSETDWRQVGIDILIGISDGIRAGVSWAVDAIKSVAGSIWDAITGFFDSSSPSMKMAGLGKNLMEGLGLGIVGSMDVPAAAASMAAGNVITSTQQTVTILGGVQLPGATDRDSFIEEISGLMI